MDPLESQGIGTTPPKPKSRRLSNTKASIVNYVAIKRKSTSESNSGWGADITRPEVPEIAKKADNLFSTYDLPTILISNTDYGIGVNLEKQYKAFDTLKNTTDGPEAAVVSTESYFKITKPTASPALNSASLSYQRAHNHTSRSASISPKGLGVSTIASHPIYEVSDEEIQSLDILWPGPVLSSHSSPKTKTRATSGSWAPNTACKDPLVMVDSELESIRTSSRFDGPLPENPTFSHTKSHISEDLSLFIAEKSKEINAAIQSKDRPLLQKLGLGKLGFINSSLRSDAWCILLHSEKNHKKKSEVSTRPHDSQIDKECSKAFLRYPSTLKGEKRRRKQKELAELLKAIFQREPKLSYYQGFRDVAACFLLVLGKRKVANAIQNAALFYFRDMMLETLGPVMRELAFGFCLIKLEDPVLHSFLVASQVQSYYGLSGILTWFSHASNSLSATSRIFDALLSSDPIFSVYLLSAATLYSRNEILKLKCEKSEVHSFLSQIPLKDIEELISSACNLFKKYPPASIEKTSKINIGQITCTYRYEKDWNSINTIEDYIRGYETAQEFISQVGASRKANIDLKCGPLSCEIVTKPTPIVATSVLMKGSILTIGTLILTYGLLTFSTHICLPFVNCTEKSLTVLQPVKVHHSSANKPLIEVPLQAPFNHAPEKKNIFESFVAWLPSSTTFDALRERLAQAN